ncbi:hypothetical protein CapIbe_022607 [Capra ibex]
MTPQDALTQQNTEQEPTGSCLTSCECDKMKTRKGTTGSSGQHPQFRGWESQRGRDTLQDPWERQELFIVQPSVV